MLSIMPYFGHITWYWFTDLTACYLAFAII